MSSDSHMGRAKLTVMRRWEVSVMEKGRMPRMFSVDRDKNRGTIIDVNPR